MDTTRSRVALEPFTEADIDQLVSWLDSEAELIKWAGSGMSFPVTREKIAAYFDKASQSDGTHFIYRVRENEDNRIIGHCGLSTISRAHHNCRIGRVLIGEQQYRGKGYAHEMIMQLLNIAFVELKLHRVELDVFDFNTAAIKCYEKCGFKREGLRRGAARCGDEYWNSIVMGCLRFEFQPLGAYVPQHRLPFCNATLQQK